ncbi:hypothetical protein O181_005529 [Austropuccinia psidii MF-1]|uniref:Uncharacterized protein n=1 Tax=Austropuccinia psidii MF-1 TaxID=1389203 RepID=A0A9Q3BIA5_9BASI|nr:hypothetical protein [Austropuccinia psidii MF-1]
MDVELTERGHKDICSSEIAANADSKTISNWNRLNGEAVHLILSRIHPTLLVIFVDTLTARNAKALWQRINNKFASHTVVNRRRTLLRWECLRFNGNIEEYINECLKIIFDVAGLGINMPPDIMAYSILGKISRDSNQYDHTIESMVIAMDSKINPQRVLVNFSYFLYHKCYKKGLKQLKTKKTLTQPSWKTRMISHTKLFIIARMENIIQKIPHIKPKTTGQNTLNYNHFLETKIKIKRITLNHIRPD